VGNLKALLVSPQLSTDHHQCLASPVAGYSWKHFFCYQAQRLIEKGFLHRVHPQLEVLRVVKKICLQISQNFLYFSCKILSANDIVLCSDYN
jgi:hypothetical protein